MFHFFQHLATKTLSVLATAIIALGIVKMPQSVPPVVAQHHNIAPTAQTGGSTFDLFATSTTTPTSTSSSIVKKKNSIANPIQNASSLSFGANPSNTSSAQTPNNTAIIAPAVTSALYPPGSNGFAAAPARISSGGSTILSFHLYDNPTSVSIEPGIGNVLGLTSVTVSPTKSTQYTLTASNSAGSITRTAWVEVVPLGSVCDVSGDVWQSDGNCRPPVATQAQQDAVALQAKLAQQQALLAEMKTECEDSITALEQQIVTIKAQYFSDLANLGGNGAGETRDVYNAQQTGLLNAANTKIQIIDNQISQAQLNCSAKYGNALPTALCNDGTFSYSLNNSGTCSDHNGVNEWFK